MKARPTPERLERVLSQAAVRHFAAAARDADVDATLLSELGVGEHGFVLTVGEESVRVVIEGESEA